MLRHGAFSLRSTEAMALERCYDCPNGFVHAPHQKGKVYALSSPSTSLLQRISKAVKPRKIFRRLTPRHDGGAGTAGILLLVQALAGN